MFNKLVKWFSSRFCKGGEIETQKFEPLRRSTDKVDFPESEITEAYATGKLPKRTTYVGGRQAPPTPMPSKAPPQRVADTNVLDLVGRLDLGTRIRFNYTVGEQYRGAREMIFATKGEIGAIVGYGTGLRYIVVADGRSCKVTVSPDEFDVELRVPSKTPQPSKTVFYDPVIASSVQEEGMRIIRTMPADLFSSDTDGIQAKGGEFSGAGASGSWDSPSSNSSDTSSCSSDSSSSSSYSSDSSSSSSCSSD